MWAVICQGGRMIRFLPLALLVAAVMLPVSEAAGRSICNPLGATGADTVSSVIFDGRALPGPTRSGGRLKSPVAFRVLRVHKGNLRAGAKLRIRIDPENDDGLDIRKAERWTIRAAPGRSDGRLVTWTCALSMRIRQPDQTVDIIADGRRFALPRTSWDGSPSKRLPFLDAASLATVQVVLRRPPRFMVPRVGGLGPEFRADETSPRTYVVPVVHVYRKIYSYVLVLWTGEAYFGSRLRTDPAPEAPQTRGFDRLAVKETSAGSAPPSSLRLQ